MCGITGVLHFDRERGVEANTLKKMNDIISHRGPDGEGFFIKNNVGLGHRRLAIIDLSTGDQPMYSDDRNKVIVFNGEIYNYIELREELVKLGHVFKTSSDTEVIVKAYEEWGVDCQNKLNGMWAFALWDDTKQELFISRDRIGEKSLNYAVFDNSVIFSSEIKSLLEYGIPKIPDSQLVELYFTLGFIPSPYTFYKGISKLKAGHYLLVKDGNIIEKSYWELPDISESDLITDEKYVLEEFERLFVDSVKIRMRSDVPFGAFLSGGLDSASIVAEMSKISNKPVETFTIGFSQKDFDERSLAKQVAEKFKTNHHEYQVEPDQFEDSLRQILFHYDEPFADPAAIPTGFVSECAAKHVKMVLTGDGGDEVLSGYRAFRGEKFAHKYQQFPKFIQNGLPVMLSGVSSMFKGKKRYRLNRYHQTLKYAKGSFDQRLISKYDMNGPYSPKDFITSDAIKVEDFVSDTMKGSRFKDPFYQFMYWQYITSLPDRMLLKVDRMSMAHSLETRIPFLDHRLVELMYRVHKDIKLPGYTTKSVLRKTVATQLPESLLTASKKGFNVPLREWFKDKSFDVVLDEITKKDFGLNNKLIKKVIEDNKNGTYDYGHFIWKMIIYNRWLEG